MKLTRLIKDFREWRREKYKAKLQLVCSREAYEQRHRKGDAYIQAFLDGLIHGLENRKEILSKVRI